MEQNALTPFAQVPPTPDPIVARLREEAEADRRLLARAPAATIGAAVEAEVRALWTGSRVKVFVPVLALRAVREALGADGPVIDVDVARPRRSPPPAPRDEDELLLDPHDVLTD